MVLTILRIGLSIFILFAIQSACSEKVQKLPPILPKGFKQQRLKPLNSETRNDEENKDASYTKIRNPERLEISGDRFWTTSNCLGDYTLAEGEGVLIVTPLQGEKLDCLLHFTPEGTNLLLELTVHELALRFNCDYESINITVDKTSILACKEGNIPTLEGQDVTIAYKRKSPYNHGGYVISITTVKVTMENLISRFQPYIDENNCGIRSFQNSLEQKEEDEDETLHTRIVGGVDAKEHEFPWQVYLEVHTGGMAYSCGGTLISTEFILSAAHCFEEDNDKLTGIAILGTERLNSYWRQRAVEVKIKKYVSHEAYDNELVVNDIALLQLAEPLTFTESITPACLPSPDIPDLTGAQATVTGFGSTSYMGDTSEILQAAQLHIWNKRECNKAWGGSLKDEAIIDSQICALGNKTEDACQGDSGGPLVMELAGRWIIIGVTSYGYKCAVKDVPGVYTRISDYIDWIQETMETMKST